MVVVRALGATLIIVAIWFVGFPYLLLSVGAEPFTLALGKLRLLGTIPLFGGGLLFIWVTWLFARTGGGTPLVFDSPVRFVSSGPYSRVRNPMYIADTMIVAGVALLLESAAILVYAGILWAALHVLVVVLEEPRLVRRFGTPYEEYCRLVPRWIPRVAKGR
jgi:protein-S-isoprenylcysteine O-methyltransferase Ste14